MFLALCVQTLFLLTYCGATAAPAAKAPPVISNAISKLHMGSIDDLIADDSMFASFPAIFPINDLFPMRPAATHQPCVA